MSETVNPFSLKEKTILILGASSGIGRQTAIRCSEAGADVVLLARGEVGLRETTDLCPGKSAVFPIDVTDSTKVEDLVKSLPGVDGVVLCAGKGLTLPVAFCSRDKFDELFEVNFFATVEFLRLMYKKKRINPGGSVVVVTSMGGLEVYSGGNSIYGASKAALDSFMKFAAKEFAPRRIRVNTIRPGMIDTPFIHRGTISDDQLQENAAKYPLKRYGKPDDVACAALYLLSDASSWVTGSSLVVDGGLSLV